jgi:hypothetical protein
VRLLAGASLLLHADASLLLHDAGASLLLHDADASLLHDAGASLLLHAGGVVTTLLLYRRVHASPTSSTCSSSANPLPL